MIRNAKIIGSITGTLIAMYILYFVFEAEFIPFMIGTVAAILISINEIRKALKNRWQRLKLFGQFYILEFGFGQ